MGNGNQIELNLPDSFAPSADELKKAMREYILSVLGKQRQPGAGELLAELEKTFDWRVRLLLLPVTHELSHDQAVKSYQKDYLRTNLSSEEIEGALRGPVKPGQEFKSTVDDLVRNSLIYKTSVAFREAIEFTARFRDYAPYNNMLVRVQNPSCSFYATARDWEERFNRQIKEDARPMLINAHRGGRPKG